MYDAKVWLGGDEMEVRGRGAAFNPALKLDLVKWLLCIAVLVAPLRAYRAAEVWGINISLFRLTWLMVVLASSLRWLCKARAGGLVVPMKIALPVWFMTIALLVSSFGPNITIGDTMSRLGVRMFGLLFIILFSILLLCNKAYICLMTRAFVFSALLPVAIGIYQWFMYWNTGSIPPLPMKQYSVIIEAPVNKTVVLYGPMALPRIGSTFLEPNYFGAFLASVILIVLSRLVYGSLGPRHAALKILSWLFLAILVAVFLCTFSLSAMFGLSLGLCILAWCTLKYKRLVRSLVMSLAVLLLFLVVQHQVSIYGGGSSLIEMMSQRVTMRWKSAPDLFGREKYLVAALKEFAKNPLVGGGAGALAYVTSGQLSSAHNTFLTIMSEQGLLGLVPMMIFFVLVAVSLYRKNRIYLLRGDRVMAGLSAGLLAAMVAALGAAQFYDALYSYDASWVLMAIAAACAALPLGKTEYTFSQGRTGSANQGL